jgi:hypothetical protein
MVNKAEAERIRYMIEIEKSIFSPADKMDININSVQYKATLKEAETVAKEEIAKGHKVEIWKLIRRY